MPEFSPSVVNTFFLAVFFMVTMTGGWKIAKFFGPLLKARYEKQTQAHDAQAVLAVSLVNTTERQTDLTERCVGMLDAHGVKLDGIASDVGHLKGQVAEIHRKVWE